MKVRIDRTRMAMEGNVHVYDVLVPVSEVDSTEHGYFVVRDGQNHVTFTDATRPPELNAMPRGCERYEAFKRHEAQANARSSKIIECVFPEVIGHDAHSFVVLDQPLPHDTRYVQR